LRRLIIRFADLLRLYLKGLCHFFYCPISIITLSLKPDFRCSISPQIEEDDPQFDKNPLFGYTKYDQLFLSLSVNLMNLQLSQCMVDLLGARKAMIHTLNKNHGAHWQFHQQGICTTSNFSAQ